MTSVPHPWWTRASARHGQLVNSTSAWTRAHPTRCAPQPRRSFPMAPWSMTESNSCLESQRIPAWVVVSEGCGTRWSETARLTRWILVLEIPYHPRGFQSSAGVLLTVSHRNALRPPHSVASLCHSMRNKASPTSFGSAIRSKKTPRMFRFPCRLQLLPCNSATKNWSNLVTSMVAPAHSFPFARNQIWNAKQHAASSATRRKLHA
mmetsp:Transcript_27334/g.76691  ORF Transcript_27334/g.76691 Transcript_27334/m.76691 type:complete len:206 (-) Transcript_27334:688-1305(-)